MANYIKFSYDQGLMIPVNLNKQITEGTIEYTINWLVDNRIDLSGFEKNYKNDETGAPAYHPAILLKIILLAYSRGIIPSRDIAMACRENVVFMALSAGLSPDFTTIAWFVRNMKDDIKNIFTNILLVCSDMDLLGGTEFGLDGCKISSNASKEYSGTFPDLKKKKEKIERTIEFLIEKHKKLDKEDDTNDNKNDTDHKKKIEKLQNKADKIEKFLNDNTPKEKSRRGEAQSNITDNESAKMKTSHGVIQGYNGMALADSKHQVIVYAEAFGSGQEQKLLQPMMKEAALVIEEIGLGGKYFEGKKVIADTGSFEESNLEYLSGIKVEAYIPDQQFRKRDPRFQDADRHKPAGKGLFKKEDFIYNQVDNTFICPAGNILKYSHYQKFNNTEGRKYISKRSQCQNCSMRKKCVKSEKTRFRTLYVIEKYFNRNYSDEMKSKIDTEEGRDIYSRRMGIIEPVFGNIKNKGMNKFTLRTKAKVNIQWMFYAIVHNICKISRYGPDEALQA
jgi:transposase